MRIDWFTVIAQILNFIVLVWILKRFLYQPVLKAMDERQERVRRSITEATAEKERAEEERLRLGEERENLVRHREDELRRVAADVESERGRLSEEAKREFESSRARWRQALLREKAEFQQELGNRAREEVVAITTKLLRDLAGADLQDRIIQKFLEMVEHLDPGERRRLQSALREGSSPSATLRTAFELLPEQKTALVHAVRRIFEQEVAIDVELKPTLVCGIEVSVDGHKLAWTIEDYLRSLEACMGELITKQTRQDEERNEITAAVGE